MSRARKDKKAVYQYTLDDKFVAEYSSFNEAEKQTGIYSANISRCCRGIVKTAGGFIWKRKTTN